MKNLNFGFHDSGHACSSGPGQHPPQALIGEIVLRRPMPDRVYLDWNATTPLRPEAREAMERAWDLPGNPSSVHAEGRQARRLVEDARTAMARAVGAAPRNVIFTSGGTEANALALSPGLRRGSRAARPKLMGSGLRPASAP